MTTPTGQWKCITLLLMLLQNKPDIHTSWISRLRKEKFQCAIDLDINITCDANKYRVARVGNCRNTQIFPKKLSVISIAGDQHGDDEAGDYVNKRGFPQRKLDGETIHVAAYRPVADLSALTCERK
uniref:Uncharacterized protein n=1 Tax=Micromonas pusilla TaxID=38833 RepID=A0A7S0KMW3_MICPS|mmetsp:Transcript_15460/g.60485  ORF Transcript_15460/g.60485 Transcript_15460/m.60485 type:complete len:126 (+) Transcript_15460:2888-3265(+)